MMMSSNNAVRLLCLLLCYSPLINRVVAQDDISEIDFTPMMRGFDNMGELQDHRRLAYWSSWSNLFFFIGACSSEGCECGEPQGPLCGCPHCDCSHKPIPPFCHAICLTGCNSTGTGGDASANSYENVSEQDNTTDSEREGQQGSSRFNWLYALAAAAGVAAAGFGVMALRKRRQTATEKSLNEEGATGRDYALMGGVTTAFAGIMSRMGLSSKDGSDSSTASDEEGSSGVVSKRMSLLKNGNDVVPLEGPNPKFISVPKTFIPDPLPVEEGIEVSGPSRLSSHYAV